MLPSLFVAAQSQPSLSAGGELVHVLDVFELVSPERAERLVVGTDSDGALVVCPFDTVTARVRQQIVTHETVTSRPWRRIEASSLWVMDTALFEDDSRVPGRNDPVFLQGVLVGPLGSPSPARVFGDLTTTRADLLSGFHHGRAHAFHSTLRKHGEGLCLHALVPGGDLHAVVDGRELVLVYPTAVSDPSHPFSNEALTQIALREVLDSLRADIVGEERDRSLLARLFFAAESQKLEADDLWGMLPVALELIQNWPNARSNSLQARTRDAAVVTEQPQHKAPATASRPPTVSTSGLFTSVITPDEVLVNIVKPHVLLGLDLAFYADPAFGQPLRFNRELLQLLAQRDHNHNVRAAYWGADAQPIQLGFEMKPPVAGARRSLRFVLEDFVAMLREGTRRQACAVVTIRGVIDDLLVVLGLLRTYEKQIETKALVPFKILLVAADAGVSLPQLEALKRTTQPLVELCVVSDSMSPGVLQASLLNRLSAYTPVARLRRPDGTLVQEFIDRLPHQLRFQNLGDTSFTLEVAGVTYEGTLSAAPPAEVPTA